MPTVDINGVSIHYEVFGAGEPVAFLNGVLMTVQSWVLQTSVIRQTHRCVMHDFRGQLLSGKPAEQWSLEDHVDDFVGLLDELGIDRLHVVGTSYGGEVGLLFAIRHPRRVQTLSVISSVSELDPGLDDAVSRWARTALEAPADLYRLSVPDNYSARFIAANGELLEQGETRLAGYPPDFFPAFARLVEAFRGVDLTARLSTIRCPTLVMVGASDRLKPPRFSELIADRIPDSRLVVVPDAGHALVIEKSEVVNAAVLDLIER